MVISRLNSNLLIFLGITVPCVGFMLQDAPVNAAVLQSQGAKISYATYQVFEGNPERNLASQSKRPRARIQLTRLSPLRHSSGNQLREWSRFEEEKDTIDRIYNPELTRTLEAQYKTNVKPVERVVESPYRFASPHEQQQYLEKNNELAQWTAKEVANDRFRHILEGADKDAAPVQVANKAKFLLGSEMGGDDSKKAHSNESSAPRRGLKPAKGQKFAEPTYYTGIQEEKIPTKLRYKMNVIRGRGEVKFTNPIIITAVNVDMSRQEQDGTIQTLDTSDRVSAQMSKNIKPLKLDSSVSYGVNRKVVSINLSKKITDQITCDVTSQHFTNDYRDSSGRSGAEEVKIGYAVTF